ncbi:MAG: agmatinase [Nitrospinota bacterium]|nr:agmatinase [Nitrospinota bacterium]
MLAFFCYKQLMENTPMFGETGYTYENASIVIVPIPFEGTVSYKGGTANGPEAIISASPNAEMFDMATERDYTKLKQTLAPQLDVTGITEEVMERIEKSVSRILDDGKMPFLLGGEHSITGPAVRAVAKHYEKSGEKIGVVQIDAHADLRDEYSGTIHSHAAVMRRIIEVAPAVQLGIRSCSIEEWKLIKEKNLRVLQPAETFSKGKLDEALATLPEKIYLTVDIDGLDPSLIPATGTPEPGGFSWNEVMEIFKTILKTKMIIGGDLVELAPIKGFHSPDFIASRLAFRMMSLMPGAFDK